MTLPPSISLAPGYPPDYPVYQVRSATSTALVARHGAQVIDWCPDGLGSIFYVSPDAIHRSGKSIRGGVPVCWPWFGAHPSDPDQPAHGFARSRFWDLASAREDGPDVILTFRLSPDSETMVRFPHDFALEFEVRAGASLHLSLTTENRGATPFPLTQALHSYFRVDDLASVRVEGLEGVPFLDAVPSPRVERPAEGHPVRFTAETDRIYHAGAPHGISLVEPGRRLTVTSTGSRSTVVWNPWTDKAARLPDLPDDGYRRFVCVETANCGRDVIDLAPGERHSLGALITAGHSGPARG